MLWKDLIKESHQTYCPLIKCEYDHKTLARTGVVAVIRILHWDCFVMFLSFCLTLKKLAQNIIPDALRVWCMQERPIEHQSEDQYSKGLDPTSEGR